MNKTQWNLDKLYTSFDSVTYKKDCEIFEYLLEELITYTKKLDMHHPIAAIEGYVQLLINVTELFEKLEAYSYLRYYANTYDTEALNHIEYIKKKSLPLTTIKTTFLRYITNVDDFDTIIQESVLLNEHQFVLNELKEASKYMLSENEERTIEQLKMTGSDSWKMLRQKLTSTLMVDYEEDGESIKLPLGIIMNKVITGQTSQKREQAYKAEIKSYKAIEESIASALNGIKGEVITISKIRGYDSPIEMSLKNSRMDKPILEALMNSIGAYLPYFQKYLDRKASLLGYSSGLPYYELFAPIGETNKHYTYETACQLIIDSFTAFSKKLGDFAAKVIENRWMMLIQLRFIEIHLSLLRKI